MMIFLIDGDTAPKFGIFSVDFSNLPALLTQITLISDDLFIISG